MSDSVLLLRLEHQNLSKLLGVLEEELRKLEAGGTPEHELLQSAADYLLGYPDSCHHPKEDLIFRKLRARDPAAAGLVDLVAEHKELARLTKGFAERVSERAADPGKRIEPLKITMRQLLDVYHHHIDMEERHFFPVALSSLSRDDWAEIDFALFDTEDPLFDDAAEERFASLRQRIFGLAERQNQRREVKIALEKQARRLRVLNTIAAFNEMMHGSGVDFRLIRYPDASYGLEAGGRLLVGIPDCSEARAAWCAYYFLKARDAPVGVA